MAFDYPAEFFAPAPMPLRRAAADRRRARRSGRRAVCASAKRPLIVAGGGVLYANATDALRAFAETHGVPVAETQAGKGALAWDHPLQQGSIGVTGSPAANALARDADVVLARRHASVRTSPPARTRCSRGARSSSVNVNALRRAQVARRRAVRRRARRRCRRCRTRLAGWRADAAWTARAREQTAQRMARRRRAHHRPARRRRCRTRAT